MSILYPLVANAPKKWKKQEKKRIQKEIRQNLEFLAQHQALRKKVGLDQVEYLKEPLIKIENTSAPET